MYEVNHTPPDRMTPEQRRREIASLLAGGLARLRMTDVPVIANIAGAGKKGLGFIGYQSVYSDPANYRNTESR